MSKVAGLLDFVAAQPQLGRLTVADQADAEGLYAVRLQLHDHNALLESFCAHLGKQLRWNSVWKKLKRAGMQLEGADTGASRLFVGRLSRQSLAGHVPSKRLKSEPADAEAREAMDAELAAQLTIRDLKEGRVEPAALQARDDLCGALWRVAPLSEVSESVAASTPFASRQSMLRMPVVLAESEQRERVFQFEGESYRADWSVTLLEPQPQAGAKAETLKE
jgi:hypothetical protein